MTRGMKGLNVLVTGGSGFIASHLVRRLIHEGAKVSVLTKYDSLVDNVRLTDCWDRVTMVEADLRNIDSLQEVRRVRPRLIFHFAAYNHVGDSFTHVNEAIDVNGRGTANLLEVYGGYERFIYISSSEVYGYQTQVPFTETAQPFPTSPYAVGKYTGELYARMMHHVYGKPIVVLRPFNAFGPFQSPRAIIAEIVLKCLRGEEVLATKGRQTREFNFIDNLVDGFLLAARRPRAVGQVINLGSGIEIPIRELVRMIHRLTDSTSKLRIGALPYRPTEIWRMAADNRKAKRLLGWSPKINVEHGLVETIAWYRRFDRLFGQENSELSRLCAG